MLRPQTPPRRRAGPAALVLGAHVLAALLLARLGTWSDRGPPAAERLPLVVRLLSLAPPTPAPAPPPPPHRQQRAATAPAVPMRQPAAARAVQSTPALTMPPAAALPATPEPALPAPDPAPAPPPPLNLALPRGASAPWRRQLPALEDPRSNSARATFESELRAAMGGDGRWALERIDEDHIRLRNGSTCIDIRRSRAEQLDGFNRSFSPKPWMGGDRPYRC